MVAAMGIRTARSWNVTGAGGRLPGDEPGRARLRVFRQMPIRCSPPAANGRSPASGTRREALLGSLCLLAGERRALALCRLHLDLAQRQHLGLRARLLT